MDHSATIQKLTNLRRNIHQYPETGFEEYQTRKKIIAMLFQFGVEEYQMTQLEPTGLYVDLRGKAEPSGSPVRVAFRADMDALSMVEANHDLPYRSKIQGKAHMCGHDGHVVCLLGFVPFFIKNIDKIPSDKVIRLLFQPSEQGPESGALKMIKEGCLNGVDEVYGFHQRPVGPVGYLWCKQGPVMSGLTVVNIKIIGTSGHGSQPEKVKDSLRVAIKFYQQALDFIDNLKLQKKGKFECTLPIFQAGERFNVISESVVIEGAIRELEEGIGEVILNFFKSALEEIKKEGFNYELNVRPLTIITKNSIKEAENVLRVGRKFFGQDKVSSGVLPVKGSEDFSFYLRQRPGAFFFLLSSKGQNQVYLHNCNFDFNDALIEPASRFWWELAKDRLGL